MNAVFSHCCQLWSGEKFLASKCIIYIKGKVKWEDNSSCLEIVEMGRKDKKIPRGPEHTPEARVVKAINHRHYFSGPTVHHTYINSLWDLN